MTMNVRAVGLQPVIMYNIMNFIRWQSCKRKCFTFTLMEHIFTLEVLC